MITSRGFYRMRASDHVRRTRCGELVVPKSLQSMTSVRVRFRDLSVEIEERRVILRVLDELLSTGELILGREVEKLEAELANFCKRRFAVGVASGTSALYLALRALGIGKGDEVVTTPLTWVATANAIVMTGATPIFVDVNDDFLMAPDLAEASITPKTAALLPVDFFGRLCDLRSLRRITDEHGLRLIVDGAQSFGATRDGCLSGQIGDAIAFSLNPMKVLAGVGEAGALIFDDEALFERAKSLRYLGTVNKETCMEPELNHKIDALHASVLRIRLQGLATLLECRQRIAATYSDLLSDLEPRVFTPKHEFGEHPTHFDYAIRCERRDELEAFLLEAGIEVKVRHRQTVPDHPAYIRYRSAHIPTARRLVGQLLCLPIHEKLSVTDLEMVSALIHDFYRRIRTNVKKSLSEVVEE